MPYRICVWAILVFFFSVTVLGWQGPSHCGRHCRDWYRSAVKKSSLEASIREVALALRELPLVRARGGWPAAGAHLLPLAPPSVMLLRQIAPSRMLGFVRCADQFHEN